jgi:hypothetical protein
MQNEKLVSDVVMAQVHAYVTQNVADPTVWQKARLQFGLPLKVASLRQAYVEWTARKLATGRTYGTKPDLPLSIPDVPLIHADGTRVDYGRM